MNKFLVLKSFASLTFLLLPLFFSCKKEAEKKVIYGNQFMHDVRHTGMNNSAPVKTKPDMRWKVKTGGQLISSPVVVDGTVYIGSGDHKLYAVNASSGTIKWTYETEGPVHSTPAVAKEKVMFLSYDGFFYALNASDGKLAWKFKTGGETKHLVKDYFKGILKPDFWDFYLSSPTVNEKNVYFGSSDSNVYALDIETGKKIWQYKTGGNIHSSPALYNNSLVVGCWDSRIYCLNASTGKKNWSYTTGRDTAQYIWLGIQASPSVEGGMAFIGSRDAKMYAFHIETGDTVWTQNKFDLSWVPSSAAIGMENIYCGSSDALSFFSINKKTGTIQYRTKTNAWTFSSPALDNEMAYIGAANGRLLGIELESGNIQWEFQTLGCQTDTIQLFDSEGKIDAERYKDLTKGIEDMPALSALFNKIFMHTGAILSSPAISNQIIYFGSSDGYIYAITDKK